MTSMTRIHGGDLRRVQREIDTVFNEFFGPQRGGSTVSAWSPRVDIHEDEQGYTVVADVPGVAKDDLRIDYHEGVLSIAGERAAAPLGEGVNAVRTERHRGAFYRAFALPQAVDIDHTEATCADGVLTVRVPKAEVARPRRIAIG